MQLKLSLILISLLWCYNAYAVPVVSEVTGTVANGQNIVISGSSFGAVGPNVVMFTDFEKGASQGASLATGTGISTNTQIGVINVAIAGNGIFDNTAKVSGDYAFRDTFVAGWTAIQTPLPADTQDVYVSYWIYLPPEDDLPYVAGVDGVNWKTAWIIDDETVQFNDYTVGTILGDNAGNITSYMIDGNDPDPGTAWYINGTNFGFIKGQWQRWSGYIKASTNSTSADGQVDFWQTNSTYGTIVGRQVLNANTMKAGGKRSFVNIPGYARENANSHGTYDDIYIAVGDGAQARVEIGEAATYSACTKLSIISPTSWTTDSITATVYSGANQLGTAYLYVTDSFGVTSSARQITIGEPPTPAPTGVSTFSGSFKMQ